MELFKRKFILVAANLIFYLSYIACLGFNNEPSSVLVLPNRRAVFKCSADTQEADVKWMRDGQSIKHNPAMGIQITKNRLIVRPISSQSTVFSELHSASFQCVISHQGFTIISQQAKLIVAELKPFPVQENVEVHITEGNIAVIPCQPPHSVPVAVTEFEFNNRTLIHKSRDRYFLLPSGNLHIEKVTKADEGSYLCIVNNPFLKYKIRAHHRIFLKVNGQSRNEVTQMTQRPVKTIGAVTGSNVTIECAAAGFPVPKISWTKRLGHLPRRRHQQIAGNLLIFNVQTEDAGSYSCVATNQRSRGVSALVTLTINELPEVRNPTGDVSVPPKSDVILKCKVSGSPKPAVTWVHNGKLLTRQSTVSIRYDSLVLKDLKKSQSGAYQCFATNDLGSSYGSSFLSVQSHHSDSVVEKPNRNNDNRRGNKKKNKKKKGGKRKNKNKNKNKVDYDNVDMTGKMVPPSRPTVSKLSDHSVMVRWDVPKNNGLKISFFKVQYRDVGRKAMAGTSEWKTLTAEIESHIRSYEVLDLDTGHIYRFRVAAVFSNNDSKFGPTSYKFTLIKDPPMKKPVIGPVISDVNAVSPSAIMITWKYKQSIDEVDIDGFFIYYRSTSTAGVYTKMTVLGANTRSHIIDHLLPNTAYEMKMQSFNMAGTSDFSNFLMSKTKMHANATVVVEEPEDNNHRNVVHVSSDTHKSSQLLYTVLGVALGIMLVGLLVFIIACSIKQRNERPNQLDHAIHSKYQDTSAHIHESHHLNGGLLTRSSPLVKNHIAGNGYISQNSAAKINISVNPLSYDVNEEDENKSPQLEMIAMNNNEQMAYSRLLQQSSSSQDMSSGCSEPTEMRPMLASEENSQIQSPTHSVYDGRMPVSNESSIQGFSQSSLNNIDSNDER